jgi:hypothetical protein
MCLYHISHLYISTVPIFPGPAPKPTPAAPTPAPPAGCDVDGCLKYCISKYGGSMSDEGPAYMCSKVGRSNCTAHDLTLLTRSHCTCSHTTHALALHMLSHYPHARTMHALVCLRCTAWHASCALCILVRTVHSACILTTSRLSALGSRLVLSLYIYIGRAAPGAQAAR